MDTLSYKTIPDTGQNNEGEQNHPDEDDRDDVSNYSIGKSGKGSSAGTSTPEPSPKCDSEYCIKMPRKPFERFDQKKFDNIIFYVREGTDYVLNKNVKRIFYSQVQNMQQPQNNLCWIAATASLLFTAQIINVNGFVMTIVDNERLKQDNYSQESIDKLNSETYKNDKLKTLEYLFTEYYANRENINTFKESFKKNKRLLLADYEKFFVDVNAFSMVQANYTPEGFFNLLYDYGPLLIAYVDNQNNISGHEILMCGITIEGENVTFHIMDPWEGEIIDMSQRDFYMNFYNLESATLNSDSNSITQVVHLPKKVKVLYQEEEPEENLDDISDDESEFKY